MRRAAESVVAEPGILLGMTVYFHEAVIDIPESTPAPFVGSQDSVNRAEHGGGTQHRPTAIGGFIQA
jgi:hypothetical protein